MRLLFLMLVAGSLFAETHVTKFFLHPNLVPDTNFAHRVLPKYLEYCNAILEKNTNQRFVYGGLVVATNQPHSNSSFSLPLEGYEVWIHAIKSTVSRSFDGYAGMDLSGAAVLAGFQWLQLYDPDAIADGSTEMLDFFIQIDHILHEAGHTSGVGLGEYYRTSVALDETGVEPYRNLNSNDPDDPYWKARPTFLTDPMLRYTYADSREQWLKKVRFSDLSAAIINGKWRLPAPRPPIAAGPVPGYPDAEFGVMITNAPPGARARIWRVKPDTALLGTATVSGNGSVWLDWVVPNEDTLFSDNLRLVKVDAHGYRPEARYVSAFDLQAAALLNGQDYLTMPVPLIPDGTERVIVRLQSSLDLGEWKTVYLLEEVVPADSKKFYRLAIQSTNVPAPPKFSMSRVPVIPNIPELPKRSIWYRVKRWFKKL